LFDKWGQGNIGSKRTRLGRKDRKLLYRQGGKSCSERSGTIFYDLCFPEGKGIMALKLLVKGIAVRGVDEVIEVNLNTVRRCLGVVAEHNKQVKTALLQDWSVSQV